MAKTIQQSLDYIWRRLYIIEVEDDLSEDLILKYLDEAAACSAQVAKRRLKTEQRERLERLKRWIDRFDRKSLERAVKKRNPSLFVSRF